MFFKSGAISKETSKQWIVQVTVAAKFQSVGFICYDVHRSKCASLAVFHVCNTNSSSLAAFHSSQVDKPCQTATMASSNGQGGAAQIKEITQYFGSKAYYTGELLKAGQERERERDIQWRWKTIRLNMSLLGPGPAI